MARKESRQNTVIARDNTNLVGIALHKALVNVFGGWGKGCTAPGKLVCDEWECAGLAGCQQCGRGGQGDGQELVPQIQGTQRGLKPVQGALPLQLWIHERALFRCRHRRGILPHLQPDAALKAARLRMRDSMTGKCAPEGIQGERKRETLRGIADLENLRFGQTRAEGSEILQGRFWSKQGLECRTHTQALKGMLLYLRCSI